MSHRYCTMFDRNYLSRGLAMIGSLQQYEPAAGIVVYAFDDVVGEVLRSLALLQVEVVSLAQFETPRLLQVKADRTTSEYFWTCTPSLIEDCLWRFELESCTYLDADLLFFAPARIARDEMRDASVLITDHFYTREYDQTATMGRYCVQFTGFRRDKDGLAALHWWRDRCLEWCYARAEDGKFGDQKYLDEWPAKFKRVRVVENRGAGVAPWNVQQYEFDVAGREIAIHHGEQPQRYPLVFFHCHGFEMYADRTVSLTRGYRLEARAIELIYAPYLARLHEAEARVRALMPHVDPHGRKPRPRSLRAAVNDLRALCSGTYNIVPEQRLLASGQCQD